MSDQREAVVSNAKYLRNVRPIDPEEISDYIENQPHPAVVRQLLREEAPSLGLIEREDGTFVPVGDEPVAPLGRPIDRFPDRYADALEDLLADRYGPNWHDGASGDLLRSVIRRVKSEYLYSQGKSVDYDEDVAAGYAIYHLPGYYAAVQYALSDLAERGLLGRELRVLDVGAGVGGPALGLCDFLPEDALLEYHAVEPSAAADVLETLLTETGRNVHPTVHRTTIESFEFGEGGADGEDGNGNEGDEDGNAHSEYDLVLLANVLSELEDPEAVLRSCLEAVADDGALLALAPADRETSIQLRELERAVEDDTTIYSPAVRLWAGERPSDRGWSFDVRPDLDVPPFQRRLDEAAGDDEHDPGEFVNVDVQFSYSILRRDGRRRIDLDLDTDRWAKMAEMERHVTNRVDLVAAKFSRSLSDAGDGSTTRAGGSNANPLFKISDGSEAVDHYAVLTNETALNRPLLEADYGDLCSFEQALVLWNDDEEAYNLVVDEETVVDRLV
ncbi:class I SAM-dependent methyltransferase [Halobacteria archaeon AArc-m2/3/4]|uniref:Class I SAM-dependent methyltransferase n=1 Tax=Natronoglomus mannanivorans TaxID=2979990 RepID=A0AAP3E2F1_9EURY|nr:class I SAM-dependent methyltransferase [Halobacteria archaeon AArc-xg1-1]MCU4975139.1 class I SAM-dependent methyltransferase [Halobacteria archaeon AArc-m2/3/4]